jgi:hypothetical protein
MQLDKLSNLEVFLIILMALLMGIGGTFLDKEKVTRFSLKSPILYQCSVTAFVFIGLFLALAIVRSVLWDIIPNVLMVLLLLGSLCMQSYLIYGSINCKKFSEFISLTITSLLFSLFGAVFFEVTLGEYFNVEVVKILVIYPSISTVIIFALSYLIHSVKKRNRSQSVNIEIPHIIELTEKETYDNARKQSGLDNLSSNILSNKDNKSEPEKKRLTVKEYWDGRRKSGVTQAEINTKMRSMPIIVPMNNEVMAHITQDGKKGLLFFLNGIGHRRLVSIDECVVKLTNFGFNCIELEDDIGVSIEGISVQTSTLVNDEWVLSAFDILRPLMSLSEVKWESNMTGQGFLLRDLLNRLGERWRLEVDFL